MNNDSQDIQSAAHRIFSAQCFNETWTYLDDTAPNISDMMSCAYASLYHWRHRDDKTQDNLLIAHWLLARAYEKAQQPHGCRLHADLCLGLALDKLVTAQSRVSAYEVQARAAALEQKIQVAKEFKAKAQALLEQLKPELNADEFQYYQDDINGITSV